MLERLRYELEADAPVGPLDVVRVTLAEALDEPYVLTVRARLADRAVDPSELIGRDAALTFTRGAVTRTQRGLVRTLREGHLRPDGGADVELEIVPALALLSLRRDTRMFQDQTAPDILRAVLEEGLAPYGRAVQLVLDDTYLRREHCLQYQESDLAFVSRLMEEEGIHYAFEHDGATELLVLRDANRFAAPIETVPTAGALPFPRHDSTMPDAEPVNHFTRGHRPVTTAVALRDLDWTSGPLVVEASEGGADALGRTRESYEHGEGRSISVTHYDEGARRYQAHDAERQARIRLEAHGVRGLVGRGVGRAIGLQPGVRFTLSGHPFVDADDAYLVTRVFHSSEPHGDLDATPGVEAYHNVFECIPLSVPYRPRRRTPKPVIPSMQTAIVTGDGEIHTDPHGRVQVLFHWDRQHEAAAGSSCWIRVRHDWAGESWGHLWIPRVGMEVVVQFMDGDPDRPLVTGALYDAAHPPPYALPAEKTKSTIKSNSSPGGGGFNEVRFEDLAGSEEMFIHAQKDSNAITRNDESVSVGVDQTISIGANQRQRVGNDQTEEIGNDQTLTVGADRTITVGGSFTETIGATSTIDVHAHATETLNAGETQTVSAGRTETVDGGETRTVNGGQTETIDGGLTQTVSGGVTQSVTGAVTETFSAAHTKTTTGSLSHTVLGGSTTIAGGSYSLTALGGYTSIAPAGCTFLTPAWFTVIAPANQTRIEAQIDKLLGFEMTIRGIGLGVTGAEIAGATIGIEAKGVSVSLTGASATLNAPKIQLESVYLEPSSVRAVTTGCRVHIAGIHLFV